MTLVYNGITERVLNSAMCGSVIFSNHSPLLENIFNDSALLTDIKDMSNIDERLGEILSNDKKRITMADSARAIVEKNNTWNNRVKDIIGLV
jgi:glycosyltransferase involved in cell wall biosynthesis